MNTKEWGPHGWIFLHAIAFNYPEQPTLQQKQSYATFFHSIGQVLPCIYCRDSFQQFLREYPIEPYLNSRAQVSYWLYMIHNLVNKKLRDQENDVPPDPSFEEICERYNRMRASCDKTKMSCSIPQDGLPRPRYNPNSQPPLPYIGNYNRSLWDRWSNY